MTSTFNVPGAQSAIDIWVLPDPGRAGGPGKATPVVAESSVQAQAQFSPDVRWIAYMSLETGTPNVYVRPFSYANGAARTGPKRLASKPNGIWARWDNRGAKLFYLTTNVQVMSIDVDTRSGFEAGAPTPLFSLMNSAAALTSPMWAIDHDRQRYLFVTAPPTGRTEPFTVVVNWESRIGK